MTRIHMLLTAIAMAATSAVVPAQSSLHMQAWSESLNTALFFAGLDWIKHRDIEKCADGTVFALNPIFLNEQVLGISDFPVTWVQNPVLQTIKFAFNTQNEGVLGPVRTPISYLQLPVAVFPSTVHGRIRAQKACFTLHGADHHDLRNIFAEKGWSAGSMLLEYTIPRDSKPQLADDLAFAGTTYSTIFPDLEGLASDLAFQFRIVPSSNRRAAGARDGATRH